MAKSRIGPDCGMNANIIANTTRWLKMNWSLNLWGKRPCWRRRKHARLKTE